LGMGDDGHIASLFPPLSDLAFSDEVLVLATATERFDVRDRISLSLNTIASANTSMFLLSGNGKKKIWKGMMASKEDERHWPAKAVLEQTNATVFARW
ncbi:6-phosphogluconolactonase, partial [Candidatus Peregrinibacteria bacterium]|nr:6-phosphogluconolactonase [Candidatus Peregrinibacteria bacterium]